MPKFFHGLQCGVAYRARAVGFGRRFPLALFPYLSYRHIKIHVELTNKGEWWDYGQLMVDPPRFARTVFRWEHRGAPVPDFTFDLPQVGEGQTFSHDVVIYNTGIRDPRRGKVVAHLELGRGEGSSRESCSFTIADFEVMSRETFWMWAITIGVSAVAALAALGAIAVSVWQIMLLL